MDEAFKPLARIIEEMMSFGGEIADERAGLRMFINACEIDSPVELNVTRDAEGRLAIGTTPPLYPLMTTIGPVFHRVRFRATLSEENDG